MDGLVVRIVNHGTDGDIECLCDRGRRYVEGAWAAHGWSFAAGQCCDCMNIRVEYGGADFGEIHVCDLDAFVEMLQAIKTAKEAAAQREP